MHLVRQFATAWHNLNKLRGFGAAWLKNIKLYQNGAIHAAVAPVHFFTDRTPFTLLMALAEQGRIPDRNEVKQGLPFSSEAAYIVT